MIIIGFDVEATGAQLGVHSMLAFGVAVVDTDTGELIEKRRWLIRETPEPRWEPRCLREFWMGPGAEAGRALLEALDTEGMPVEDAMRSFVTWCANTRATYGVENVRLVTDNAAFDAAWMSWYLATHTSVPSLHYVFGEYRDIVDTSSFQDGVAQVSGAGNATSKGLSHMPDEDAAAVALAHATLLKGIRTHLRSFITHLMKVNSDTTGGDAVALIHEIVQASVEEDATQDFVATAIAAGALRFGDFTLKSGHHSPYFFDTGQFASGRALATLGKAFAQAIDPTFEVLFGPAYKGIPIVTATASALAATWSGPVSAAHHVPFTYSRKEAKDHGEGGSIIGADVAGRRCLILDDVVTSGATIDESVALIKTAGGIPVGVVVALDRQEGDALQQTASKHGIPIHALITVQDIIKHLENNNTGGVNDEVLARLKEHIAR